MQNLTELLTTLVSGLIDNPEKIEITVDEPNEEGVNVFHLRVASEDMGRIIGKEGRIAKAIRVVMRAAANRQNLKISVDIDD